MLVAAGSVSADEAVVKYRQSVYKAIGGHTAALAAIVKREVDFTQDAQAHAIALGQLAPMTKHVFPAGSDTGKTDALPAIWEKPERFAERSDAFIVAATKLAEAAEAGDMKAIGPALGEVGKTCKACHDEFRKKQ